MGDQDAIGRIVGQYKILSKIGAGGMGEVYLAYDSKLDRRVAIKSLGDAFKNDEARLSRFIAEAKATSALNHPNILTIFEIIRSDEDNFIVSEFVEGVTLKALLKNGRPSLPAALDMAIHVASALNAAHKVGIVHRDIKPANIMIRNDGIVKVVDFGIAKMLQPQFDPAADAETPTIAMGSTEPGVMVGTPRYMSPEQARSQDVDGRSDIFSFGIVMYELFTGARPFDGEEAVDVISSILKDDPEPMRSTVNSLPQELERVVEKALRKDRNQRYQQVKDLLLDLEDIRDDIRFEARLGHSTDGGDTLRDEITLEDPDRGTDAGTVRPTMQIAEAAVPVVQRTPTYLYGALIIAAVIAAAWWLYNSAADARTGTPQAVGVKQVASWVSAPGELYSNASFSPDGKLIAFASTRSGIREIWVTQSGSTEAIKITGDTISNRDPVWSPQGDEIAFVSERGRGEENGSGTGIWRISALGGGTARFVAPLADGSSELRRWGKSGKIYYQLNGELFAADLTAGESRAVTSYGGAYGKIQWITIAEDEQEIAFVAFAEDRWRLYTGRVGSPEVRQIAETPTEMAGVAWHQPTGQFYFGGFGDGAHQVYSIARGGRSPERVTTSDTDSVVLDVSPDGSAVLLLSTKEDSNLWRLDVKENREAPVARSVTAELWPDISPDGRQVAYQSIGKLSLTRGLFDGAIVVKDAAPGSADAEAVKVADKGLLPVWSPDGTSIAFLRDSGEEAELWSATTSGGGERLLAAGRISKPGYSVSPYNHIQTAAFAWKPDSSSIAYVSSRDGAANIWQVGKSGEPHVRLTSNSKQDLSVYSPVWDRTGSRLAYYSRARTGDQIAQINITGQAGAEPKSIYSDTKPFRLLGWSENEDELIIAETDRLASLPPETRLKAVHATTGSVRPIAVLPNAYYFNVVLGPGGRSFAYAARNDDLDDLWYLAAGGQPRKLTSNNDPSVYFSKLSWSPDGSAIIFGKQSRFSLLSMLTGLKQ